jgi:hypothetical protein
MKRVKIYRNLHKKCLSVLHRTEKGWRLWKHVPRIEVFNAVFKVSQAGRERVLREKRKNVHAFIEGDYAGVTNVTSSNLRFLRYNPYEAGHFFDAETKKLARESSWAFVNEKGIMAINVL